MNFSTFAIFLALIAIALSASNCGGNCPANNCPTCYCGTNQNIQDITTWCSKHTWNKDCCKCIVSRLSAGNANAITHMPNGSVNAGLWQINNQEWGSCSNGKAPCDPQANLNCAIKIYQWGDNSWKYWDIHTACGC